MVSTAIRYPARTAVRERNREALLRTAFEIVVESGYHRTSVDEIARRAGLTKGAVYSIFGSKAALFAEVLRQRRTPFSLSSIVAPGVSVSEALDEVGRFWARFAREPGSRAHLVLAFELGLDVIREGDDSAGVIDQTRAVAQRFADELEEVARASGEELPRPAFDIAIALLGAVQGLAILHITGVDAIDEQQFIRTARGALA